METNTSRRIGRIHATIGGDYRYATTIEVYAVGAGLEVRLLSTNPVGGMDGPGGTESTGQVLATWEAAPAPAELLGKLRKLFKTTDGGTVAVYGKPTKNFTWYYANGVITKGFNAALAKRAMEAA